ncbi:MULTISPECIES: DUF943 family protein [unclassified Cedecea]|uniref:DUF943 family protein n=2 Tax=Cedecea TaxID=158483 RepID=UPI003017EA00
MTVPELLRRSIQGLKFLAGGLLAGYCLWLAFRPVEIVAVHQRNSYSDVLVEGFPFTKKGKVHWWLKNKAMLKEKYGAPGPEKDGFYVITFWYFGDGYVETDGYDRLCFDDLDPPLNCIDKDKAFTVWQDRYKNTVVIFRDGQYRLSEKGDLIKYQ